MDRIGLMGGTFNPIHLGHMISACEIIDLLGLKKMLIIPCALPPHKDHCELIQGHHRLTMASLATASNQNLTVSSMEIDRGGMSYSIDTINILKEESRESLEPFFVVGIDVFSDIASWKDVETLFTSSHFVVTNRPGYDETELLEKLTCEVTPSHPALRFHLKGESIGEQVREIIVEGSPYSIFLVNIPAIDISSTEIRKRVAQGRPIRYLVTPEVEQYIIEHGLYAPR